MTVELISVGTELLMGNIVNSNTQFLAEKCAMLGLDMYYQVTVGDNYGRMKEVVKTALGRSDIIILTGGLGPTEDDLTKEVCADVMGMELVEDLHTRKHLEAFLNITYTGKYRITTGRWPPCPPAPWCWTTATAWRRD